MPKLSNRGTTMPASPIRKLVPFAEQAKRNGKKIYHLNIGQPDIKTPASAIQAVKNADIEVVAYSFSCDFKLSWKTIIEPSFAFFKTFSRQVSFEILESKSPS